MRTGLDCACFHAAPGACVRDCVCVCVSWQWFKTRLSLKDIFICVFCWIWTSTNWATFWLLFLFERMSLTVSYWHRLALVASTFPPCVTGIFSVGFLLMMFSAWWTGDVTPLGQSHISIKEGGFTHNFNVCVQLWCLTWIYQLIPLWEFDRSFGLWVGEETSVSDCWQNKNTSVWLLIPQQMTFLKLCLILFTKSSPEV